MKMSSACRNKQTQQDLYESHVRATPKNNQQELKQNTNQKDTQLAQTLCNRNLSFK